MTDLRTSVGEALKTRLETITTANGYDLTVKKVWFDDIPLGLGLSPEDLPALLLLDDGASFTHEHQLVNVQLAIRVQIVESEEAPDNRLNAIIRAIGKAVWANSAVAEVQDQFRFHPKVYQVAMESDETDLHVIDGNRIATTRMIVHYRTRPYDL
jgi:hypothetical protein